MDDFGFDFGKDDIIKSTENVPDALMKLIEHNYKQVDAIGKEDKCSIKPSVKPSVKPAVKPAVKPSVKPSVKPAVKPKERKTIDKHKNITTETLLATEPYRIEAMFGLLKSTMKDTTKQQAVRYLLSYSDLLDKDMAREVIDIANKMMVDSSVRDTVKVKVASDLKAFLGTAGKKKFVRSTFEELRKEDGFLEVEVPD